MSNLTYVRWKPSETRRCRAFPALTHDHPSFEADCLLCGYSLGSDIDGVQLLAVGPDDDDNRAKHEADRWYSAAALIVHTSCLADMDDDEVEAVIRELRIQEPSAE